jgi:hypothetical protein
VSTSAIFSAPYAHITREPSQAAQQIQARGSEAQNLHSLRARALIFWKKKIASTELFGERWFYESLVKF